MSHITKIATQMAEREFLLAALQDLGYKYEEGNLTISGFGTNKVQVEIKIDLRLSYDIGFRKNGQFFEIVADWWGVRGVQKEDFTRQLLQRYAYHAARNRLEEQGFTLVDEQTDKGEIRLVLRRMA